MTDTMIPDLSGLEIAPEVQSWEPIPEGKYKARAKHAQYGTSKNGSTMLIADWEVTEGEHAGKIARCWTVFAFKSGINPSLIAHLDAVGLWPATQDERIKALGEDRDRTFNTLLEKILGQEAEIDVEVSEGRIRVDEDGQNIPEYDENGEVNEDEDGNVIWARWPSRSMIQGVTFRAAKKPAKKKRTLTI